MVIDLGVYPRENLERIKDMFFGNNFPEEFEHLYFKGDYNIFAQIEGFAKPTKIVVPATKITTNYKCGDKYGEPLTYAHCSDFEKIILPDGVDIKNKAIINFLASLPDWVCVLYWC